jgi:hypothetical protein
VNRPATRNRLLSPRVRELLLTTEYVMRHVFAVFFIVLAGVVVITHLLLWNLGIRFGGDVWAWSIACTFAAVGLAWLSLPERRPLPRLIRRRRAPAEPVLWKSFPWDAEATLCERLWDMPPRRPPHEIPLRQAMPPADSAPDGPS